MVDRSSMVVDREAQDTTLLKVCLFVSTPFAPMANLAWYAGPPPGNQGVSTSGKRATP